MIYYDENVSEVISQPSLKIRYGYLPSDEKLAELKIYPFVSDPSKTFDLYDPGPVDISDGVAYRTYTEKEQPSQALAKA